MVCCRKWGSRPQSILVNSRKKVRTRHFVVQAPYFASIFDFNTAAFFNIHMRSIFSSLQEDDRVSIMNVKTICKNFARIQNEGSNPSEEDPSREVYLTQPQYIPCITIFKVLLFCSMFINFFFCKNDYFIFCLACIWLPFFYFFCKIFVLLIFELESS